MNEFDSSFWPWMIGIVTIAGILALFALIRWMTRVRESSDPGTTGHVWDENLEELNNPLPRWWMAMFNVSLVFGLVYLVLFPGLGSFNGILSWSSTDQYEHEMKVADVRYGQQFDQYRDEPIKALIENAAAVKAGERLFAAYCTACHGSDAGGMRGYPSLRDAEWQWGGTPEAIEQTLLEGRMGVMPPLGPALGADGVLATAEYVRTLSGQNADPTLAEKGKALFETHCVACHGAQAQGNPMLGALNLTDNIWRYGGSQKHLMETIEKGRQGQMPPWRDVLGESKVHLLATYVYSMAVDAERRAH